MANMQHVLALLKTQNRVVLGYPNRKEDVMKKAKKETKTAKKSGAAKAKGAKAAKVTMTKPEAVNAAMQAVDQDKKKRSSGLDAAAQVLREAGEPLDCKTIVERALAKGLWKTGGKTPSATIYSAIIREIGTKGDKSRFKKAARGKFEFAK